MLFLEVPPFDMLTEQTVPYTGFGEAQVFSLEPPTSYLQTVRQSLERVTEIFGVVCDVDISGISAIEKIICQMWTDGWNPQEVDVNLFTTAFGCLVSESLRSSLSGLLVLRSETDISHASIWWPEAGIEAFPFHKTYKRLIGEEGESLVYFAERLCSLLNC